MSKHSNQRGFSLFELLIAMAISGIVVAGAVVLYQKSLAVSTIVTSRADLQAELRSGMNQIARDLNQAGTGIPQTGIPIPTSTTGGVNPKFACDGTTCYIAAGNVFKDGVLYKITPANSVGTTTSEATDAIVITYMDPIAPSGDINSSATGLDWSASPTTSITAKGDSLIMPAGTTPALNDPQKGLTVGDMLLMQNDKGSAVGVVTAFNAATGQISFATNDPLKLNQPASPAVPGTLASLAISPLPIAPLPFYKPTVISRIVMVTYFIRKDPVDSHPVLMRQVNARQPSPVAENIEDLQITYDALDDSTDPAKLVANLPDAAVGSPPIVKPNQIRKVNVSLTARSPQLNANGQYDRMSIQTSVGPRNLSFSDQYY